MQTDSFHIFQRTLGANIQRFRKAAGLSQEKMGELIGIDRVSVGYIEQGKRSPRLATLFAMANVLEIDVAEFFLSPSARIVSENEKSD